jgi:hypothetical protein
MTLRISTLVITKAKLATKSKVAFRQTSIERTVIRLGMSI